MCTGSAPGSNRFVSNQNNGSQYTGGQMYQPFGNPAGNAPVDPNLASWQMPGANSSLTPGWVPNSQAMFDQNVTAGAQATPGTPAWIGSLLGLYNMTPQTNSTNNYGRFNWLTGNSQNGAVPTPQTQTDPTGPAPGSLPPSIGGSPATTPQPVPTSTATPTPTATPMPNQAPTSSPASGNIVGPYGGKMANWYGTTQQQVDAAAQRRAKIASNSVGGANWTNGLQAMGANLTPWTS